MLTQTSQLGTILVQRGLISPKDLEEALAEGAMTPAGRRLARARQWAADAEVEGRLDEVAEARALLAEGAAPPLGGVQDLEPHLAQAAKGAVLGGVDDAKQTF